MRLKKVLVLALSLLCAVLLAGCDEQNNPQNNPGSSNVVADNSGSSSKVVSNEQSQNVTMDITVYYPDANAEGLVPVTKTIKTTDADKYQGAVEALLAGTENKSLTNVFPKNVKLLKVTVKGDTAKVDFDKNLVKGFAGGSTGEEMLVGSVVNTLTDFPEVKKVQFMVDGKNIDSISGHMDLSDPVTRMDELIKK